MTEFLNPFVQFFSSVPALRAVIAFVLMFFLPGFAWTLVFFGDRRQINLLERLAMSIGLSIAIVVLCVLALNVLLHISITSFHTLLIILMITVIPIVWYCLRRIISRRSDSAA